MWSQQDWGWPCLPLAGRIPRLAHCQFAVAWLPQLLWATLGQVARCPLPGEALQTLLLVWVWMVCLPVKNQQELAFRVPFEGALEGVAQKPLKLPSHLLRWAQRSSSSRGFGYALMCVPSLQPLQRLQASWEACR